MKKVVLLGDSIRQIGYGKTVQEKLEAEGYTVWQPEENCRFAKYTLRMLFDYKEQIEGSDIIHWNNGLWDVSNLFGDGLFSSKEEYVATMERIANILLKITPHVIFATTTPVRDEYPYQNNADIQMLNAAVVPVLKAKGIQINDLFSSVYPSRAEMIRDDDLIHLNEKGIDICSKQVINAIKSVKL